MEYEVVIARSALRDLEQIRTYIARDNPTAAQTFALRMLDWAESLRTFPERGGFIAERPGARFVIVFSLLSGLPNRGAIAYGARIALLAWSPRTSTDALVSLVLQRMRRSQSNYAKEFLQRPSAPPAS